MTGTVKQIRFLQLINGRLCLGGGKFIGRRGLSLQGFYATSAVVFQGLGEPRDGFGSGLHIVVKNF